MIPTIGVVVCLYVFARCVEMTAVDAQHTLVKAVAGSVAIIAAVAAVWLIRSASTFSDALASGPAWIP